MLRIAGRIVTREDGAGIPDLVVAAYDLTGLFPAPDERKLSLQETGRRMSTVLTDVKGAFEMSLEDLRFDGNEHRPDLVLRVFAPEDVHEESLVPLPSEKRLLYASTLPRRDAGASEVFFIRLPASLLGKFSIASSADEGRKPPLLRALQRSHAASDAVRSAMKERSSALQERGASMRAFVRERTAELSGIPLHLRNGVLVDTSKLIDDRSKLADLLPAKIVDSANEAFARWKENRPSFEMELTVSEARSIGLSIDRTDKDAPTAREDSKVDPTKLAALVRKAFGGTDLVRKRGLDNPSVAVLRQMYLSAPPADSPGEPE